jgi:hypothetical protein
MVVSGPMYITNWDTQEQWEVTGAWTRDAAGGCCDSELQPLNCSCRQHPRALVCAYCLVQAALCCISLCSAVLTPTGAHLGHVS